MRLSSTTGEHTLTLIQRTVLDALNCTNKGDRLRIVWANSDFVLDAPCDADAFLAKLAGFVFNTAEGLWHGDHEALEDLRRHRLKLKEPLTITQVALQKYKDAGMQVLSAIEESHSDTSDLLIPCPSGINPTTGLPYAYMPFQKAGIAYAIKRRDTLIGDEPGVGKTMQGIGFSNCLPDARSILVVCPAFLKGMWRDKFTEWDVKGLSVGVASGVKNPVTPETDVVIINYDIAYAHNLKRAWDVKIVDEAHKLKDKKSRRAKAVFGIKAARNIYLTGTPSLNGKPAEIWPLIEQIDPEGIGKDWWAYMIRYAQLAEVVLDPRTGKTRWIPYFSGQRKTPEEKHQCWLTEGAANLEELQALMRSKFMVRRKKSQVLKELPPKRREIIPLEIEGMNVRRLKKEIEEFEKYTGGSADELYEMPEFGGFSEEMLETGLKMVKPAIEIAKYDLEEMETKKLVIMCYHKEVAGEIAKAFDPAKVLLVTGNVAPGKRYPLTQRFQTEPGIEVLVGTIDSCSEGLEMYAAWEMIFPERSWVPGSVTQAEDRIHRKGQTGHCLYRHLVLEGSLQERQTKSLIRKQIQADAMLDRKEAA